MKKNNFLPGIFVGFLATLLLSVAIFNVYVTRVESKQLQVGSATVSNKDRADGEVKSTSAQVNSIMNKIEVLESIIEQNYLEEVDNETLANGIYKGLLDSLNDPYSCYYTADEYTRLMESTAGIYCGIGAVFSQNVKTNTITVVKPFVDGPAYKAGLRPNDVLYKVNGEDVTDCELTEVVSKVKGEEGTPVTITIVREGVTDPIDLVINRASIEVPTVEYKMMENDIGYISVSEFDKVTAPQYRKAIKDLEKQGMKGLVVDIRDNPGGRLDTVVDMLDRMLPKGLIVYQENKEGKRDEERSTNKEKFTKPLAVLINGNSASASEIFAGAIQDYGTGTIVGTTSFGKGIVQSIIPLTDGTAVKVTVSKYYTPNGRNIHGTGIEPDVKVELPAESANQVIIDYKDDTQLQKAVDIIKEQLETK